MRALVIAYPVMAAVAAAGIALALGFASYAPTEALMDGVLRMGAIGFGLGLMTSVWVLVSRRSRT